MDKVSGCLCLRNLFQSITYYLSRKPTFVSSSCSTQKQSFHTMHPFQGKGNNLHGYELSSSSKSNSQKPSDKIVSLDEIQSIHNLYASNSLTQQSNLDMQGCKYDVDKNLNSKISLFEGDITKLKLDAIVNAANSTLLGGGGVDAAIHSAAGPEMTQECRLLHGCNTGEAKMTRGYNLPAQHIIHTVGPMGENPLKLESCYVNSLQLAVNSNLRSIAFPCIATGVYGYPNDKAAALTLNTIRTFLEAHHKDFDRVIFCLFMDKDKKIYKQLVPLYFPPS